MLNETFSVIFKHCVLGGKEATENNYNWMVLMVTQLSNGQRFLFIILMIFFFFIFFFVISFGNLFFFQFF